MNPLRLLVLLVSLPLLLGGCGGEASVNLTELEVREGISYLKGSDAPYTGKVFELDGNGNKQREGFYKDGRREGIMIVWYYNGQKMREGNFKDGELDGLFIRWHMNGEKRAEGSFKDGKLVEGSEKFWNSKGEPVDSKEEAFKK